MAAVGAAATRVGAPPVARRRRRRLTTITSLLAAAAITAALLVVVRIRGGDGAVPSGTGWHHPQPGRLRGSDSDEDFCGMAGEPACHRAASVGQRPLLRGLAEEPERRARPHRHFQPTKQHHFVGRSATDQFPRPYRHPPAGQRQSRFAGPTGADRRGSTRSLTDGVGRCRALRPEARGRLNA